MSKEEEILEKLKEVKDPEFGHSIIERKLIDEVKVEGDTAKILFHLTVPFCPDVFALFIGREIRKKAKEVEGIKKVEIAVQKHAKADKLNEILSKEE
ncbi:MAG: iron-sulfur cluster assembly protein [candidate division Zixibacteria bacterium]|jgi:metal-sulfur cluster biosynthetic enzyme|nr:iron-sulfur cluster assembly protein [candidate division Zixibacteria bacterium]